MSPGRSGDNLRPPNNLSKELAVIGGEQSVVSISMQTTALHDTVAINSAQVLRVLLMPCPQCDVLDLSVDHNAPFLAAIDNASVGDLLASAFNLKHGTQSMLIRPNPIALEKCACATRRASLLQSLRSVL